jgi:SAM-dependent methyltransferase
MPDVVSRRDDCRLCGGKDLELVLPLTPAPIVDAYVPAGRLNEVQSTYAMDVFLCLSCGHAQLLDVLDPRVLYPDYIYETKSTLGLVEHFEKYAREITERVSPRHGTLVVDIGSNDGSLLRFFRSHGMRVLGVDPAREIARKATEAGIETLPNFFTSGLAREIKEKRGAATIVTANHLFANVDDLAELAEGVRDLLDPEGVFVFETSYLVDLIQNMVFDFIYHEHLNCFSVKPLKGFFLRHGMELIDVERVPTRGGSIRGIVQHLGGLRPVQPSLANLISSEECLGIGSTDAFERFAGRIEGARNQVVGLLRDLNAKGMTIAGYGASATTTTLIYHFGFGDVLSFIVDDNPAKQGLFSPGLHIPVLPPQVIYQRNPDYVLVLAWRYAEAIMSKHRSYLEKGGHFVLPLPQMRVV